MKYILCVALLFQCLISYSQDARKQAREYEEKQAANKRSEERIHQQYLNNLPNKSGTSSGGGTWLEQHRKSQQAAQAWLDSRKRKAADDYQPSEELILENRYRAAGIAQTVDYLRKTYTPFAEMIKKEGFKLYEGYHMAELLFSNAGKAADSVERELTLARHAKHEFDQRASAGSLEELFGLAIKFKVAGLSAITAVESLKIRFPDKTDDIDMMMIQLLPALADFSPFVLRDHLPEQNPNTEEDKRRVDIFKYLLQKYPVETARADAFTKDSPTKRLGYNDWLYNPKDQKSKPGLFLFILQAAEPEKPLPRTVNYFKEGYQVAFKRMQLAMQYFGYENNSKYLKGFTMADWKKIAQDKGLPVLDLTAAILTSNKTRSRLEDYPYLQGKGYQDVYEKKTLGYEKLVKSLAEEGDAHAMNAYAVRIAVGLVKGVPRKEATAWLYKAVDAGSFMGAINLNLARDWGIDEYMTEANLATADARILSFFDKASDKDNYEAAMLFCQNNWPDIMLNDGRQRVLARRFINHAASNGYAPAMQVLVNHPSLKL